MESVRINNIIIFHHVHNTEPLRPPVMAERSSKLKPKILGAKKIEINIILLWNFEQISVIPKQAIKLTKLEA